MASSLPPSSASSAPAAGRAGGLVALAALILLVGVVLAVLGRWRDEDPAVRAGGGPATAGAGSGGSVSPQALTAFVSQGVQPGNAAEVQTGQDRPLYRGPEGTEFFRFRFARQGDIVTAGYRVRLGPQHEFYVLQDYDCTTPRVKPLAAGPSILELQFEPHPVFGPLDDSHADTRLRAIFCAMKE